MTMLDICARAIGEAAQKHLGRIQPVMPTDRIYAEAVLRALRDNPDEGMVEVMNAEMNMARLSQASDWKRELMERLLRAAINHVLGETGK